MFNWCKKIIVFSVFSFWSHVALAQFPNIMISNTNDPEEVSIHINPKNTNQVVAGANLNNLFVSNDGGLTWNVSILTDPLNGVWGDPIVFTDTTGNFYYAHLSNPPAGTWIDRIVFQKSTDGGVTWGAGTYTGLNGIKAQDKEGIAVNHLNNEIYVTWSEFDSYGSTLSTDSSRILFSKSTDAGATWSTPVRISKIAGDCIDSDNTVEGAVPTVGPAGEIYVSWVGTSGIVFNKSLDGGTTWLPMETHVTTVPGGWDYMISGLQRCNGLPSTHCDISGGPNHGTIYINWTDQRNGTTDTDVWLVKSTDGGNTWTSPLRVNDDAPGKQQFLTWMAIDQASGNIFCLFYDRRNYSTGNQTDVYLAKSMDGGNTFINYQINEFSFVPSPVVFFGDYVGLSVVGEMVRPIWMEYSSGNLSVWTAAIDATTLGMNNTHEVLLPAAELANSPNPFNDFTRISFKLLDPTTIDLFIFNAAGQKVATLYTDEPFKKGNFDYILNSNEYNLEPGIYYYTLICDKYQLTKKMVIY
jgi:hypothetical protein